MEIGKLNRRIQIRQSFTVTDPVYGSDVTHWLPLVDVWANIQDVMPSRDESVLSGSLEVSQQRIRIRIRWRKEVTSANQIRINYPTEKILEIVGGPAEIGGNRAFLEIMCEQISSG